jgi:hypothetical protein
MIVEEQWFTCRSCENEYSTDDLCDHLPTTHIWCWECCHEFYEIQKTESIKEDFD